MTFGQTEQTGLLNQQTPHLIRSAVLVGPCEALSSMGGQVSDLLADSGLSEQHILQPESILNADEYLDVMARIEHAGDDGFLFDAGAKIPLELFGLTGLAVQSAATLGEAIDLTRQILGYLQSDSTIEITKAGNRCQLWYRAGFGETGELVSDMQYSIGVLSSLVCLGQHKYDPELVVYYPNAKNSHMLSLLTSARLRESHSAMIEFDHRILKSRMPKSNDNQAEVLRRFLLSNSIDRASCIDLTETVRQLVDHSMGIARPTQRNVCQMLGVSVRSLQRTLKKKGTTFRQILESSRESLALRELRNGKGVTETALFLGYDHPQNFTTACYRWFGRSPSAL